MGRNFSPRHMRRRFNVWRDRRRYPWRYPESGTPRFGRAPRSFRRRFFVIRSVEHAGWIDHHIVAECPNYSAAVEVAALHGDRVFTEGQMHDHVERLRALTTWDRGDSSQRSRQPTAAARRRQTSSDALFTIKAPNG